MEQLRDEAEKEEATLTVEFAKLQELVAAVARRGRVANGEVDDVAR